MCSSEVPVRRWRVVLADDHPMVRDGMVALLQKSADIEVVGICSDSSDTRATVAKTKPDVVIADYFLDDAEDGCRLIRDLKTMKPAPRVLALSMHRSDEIGERVIRAGADGFICKREPSEALLHAIRSIADGKNYFSAELRALLLDRTFGDAPRAVTSGLSDRELQVFRLIAAALPVGEIASRLGISVRTVAAHRENLKNKLNVESADALAVLATRWLAEQQKSSAS